MDNIFVLTAKAEDGRMPEIYCMSKTLRELYVMVLAYMGKNSDKCQELQIAQLEDTSIIPIISAKIFIEVMASLDSEINELAIKKAIKSRNTDFMVAFLREIISPKQEPDKEQRQKYCRILRLCKAYMSEGMLLYIDICNVGLQKYCDDWWM